MVDIQGVIVVRWWNFGLKDRIKVIARARNRSFNDLWKTLVLERFLARLSRLPPLLSALEDEDLQIPGSRPPLEDMQTNGAWHQREGYEWGNMAGNSNRFDVALIVLF